MWAARHSEWMRTMYRCVVERPATSEIEAAQLAALGGGNRKRRPEWISVLTWNVTAIEAGQVIIPACLGSEESRRATLPHRSVGTQLSAVRHLARRRLHGRAYLPPLHRIPLHQHQNLCVANCQSSGSGELIQPAAVGSPPIVVKVNHAATSSGGLADRSAAIQ